MIRRLLSECVLQSLADTPVVLLNGARQTGKTTLVQSLRAIGHPARYVTFDDAAFLGAALADPAGFLAGLQGPVILDEVQHVPTLFPVIKMAVDRDRTPGRFLLTGSANVMLLPKLSESLAGRMEIHTLWPLAQREIERKQGSFIDRLFSSESIRYDVLESNKNDLIRRVLTGGYPEALRRASDSRRAAWFGSYLTTILQRDVREIARIEGLGALPRLLSILASRTAGLFNQSDISRDSGLPYTTLSRYMSLLEATYLIRLVPAWSSNIGLRFVKSAKLMLADTGLAASLLGLNATRLEQDGRLFGNLLENFVAMELIKEAGWSRTRTQLFHFRTHARQEVDLALEDAGGKIVGIEIKAASTVVPSDLAGLRTLADAAGSQFVRGLVLYTGEQVVPFAENLHAVPIAALWN